MIHSAAPVKSRLWIISHLKGKSSTVLHSLSHHQVSSMSGGQKFSSLYLSLDKFAESLNGETSGGYIYLYDVVFTTSRQEVDDGPPASSAQKGSL